MRKMLLLLLSVFLVCALTSCYDANELDELINVIGIGIDPGVSDKLRLSLMFSTSKGPGSGGGASSGGGEQQQYAVITVDAPSFFAGVDMFNSTLGRTLSFNHIEFIMFSEDSAKKGISEYIAALNRYRELRLTTSFFICKGKAYEQMKESKPLIGTGMSKTFHLISQKGAYTGFFPDIDFRSFYECLKSSNSQATAPLTAVNGGKNFIKEGQQSGGESVTGGHYIAGELPREGDNKIDIFGTAIFKGDKMVGELNGDETRFFLMARGKYQEGRFTMQDPEVPDKVVVLDVTPAKAPKTEIKFEGEDPLINVTVYLDGDIYSVQSMTDYESMDKQPELEEAFKKTVKEGIDKTIGKCCELGVDIFGFGQAAKKNFLTIDQFESYDWNKHFSNAKVTAEVVFNIRRTGTMLKSNPVRGE